MGFSNSFFFNRAASTLLFPLHRRVRLASQSPAPFAAGFDGFFFLVWFDVDGIARLDATKTTIHWKERKKENALCTIGNLTVLHGHAHRHAHFPLWWRHLFFLSRCCNPPKSSWNGPYWNKGARLQLAGFQGPRQALNLTEEDPREGDARQGHAPSVFQKKNRDPVPPCVCVRSSGPSRGDVGKPAKFVAFFFSLIRTSVDCRSFFLEKKTRERKKKGCQQWDDDVTDVFHELFPIRRLWRFFPLISFYYDEPDTLECIIHGAGVGGGEKIASLLEMRSSGMRVARWLVKHHVISPQEPIRLELLGSTPNRRCEMVS